MPGIENIETLWDFIELMLQLFSIFFVWYAGLGWIGKHQEQAKEIIRDPNSDEHTDQRIFGIHINKIIRNGFYIVIISCAAYITITILQNSKF